MLFTDISAERVIKAMTKAGFKTITRSKHIGLSDGVHRITIPNHKRLNPYTLKAIIDEQFKELL